MAAGLMISEKISIYLKKDAGGTIPSYETSGAAGADLYASDDVVIKQGKWARVPTGLYMAIPSGYEVQIRPRSGLAFKHGVTVLNSPGTIDSDYRGEVGVLLVNHGDKDFEVHKGDRIAQMVVARVEQARFELRNALPGTERGCGGFGSTGV